MATYNLRINGNAQTVDTTDADKPLLYVLRELGLARGIHVVPEELREERRAIVDLDYRRYEPPAVAAGLSFDKVREIVVLYAQRAPGDRLTIVARDQPTGRLIGAMLTDDFASPPPDHLEHLLSGNFRSIVALLEGLDEQYRRVQIVDPGKILHLFMLGVAPHFGGRGVARMLVQQALENGKHRGYELAITEAAFCLNLSGFEDVDAARLDSRRIAAVPLGEILAVEKHDRRPRRRNR